MERMAVYYDDVNHARRLLEPMLNAGDEPALWVMVACAPRMTHRIGKWLSHTARQHWRQQWAQQQRQALEPSLLARHAPVDFEWMLATGPLPALTQRLRVRHGSTLRVLDARRPRLGELPVPVQEQAGGVAPATPAQRLAGPLAVSSSLALVLTLAD